MACLIDRDNFAMTQSPIISNPLTLRADGWSSQRQSVSVDIQDFPLLMFQLNTINIPPEDLPKWAEYGIYPVEASTSAQKIYFSCSAVPSEDLVFTVTQEPVNRIGDFIGTKFTLTGYVGTDATLYIPYGVRYIAENVFKNNTDLTAVYFPSFGLVSIGSGAFEGCTALTTITFYSSVTVTANMFEGCAAVTDIIFDMDNGAWGENADFSFTTQINANRLETMIEKLYDYSGGTAHTLKIGAANKSRLTAELIAEAEAKNWSVV